MFVIICTYLYLDLYVYKSIHKKYKILGDRRVVQTMVYPGETVFIPKSFAYSIMNVKNTVSIKETFFSKGMRDFNTIWNIFKLNKESVTI